MKTLATTFLILLFVVMIQPATGLTTCYDCHEEKTFQGPHIHQPVADGQCDKCHAPHAAKYPALLRQPVNKLCSTCHLIFFKQIGSRRQLHDPVARGKCGTCHDPHASAYRKLLINTPGTECYQCHTNETSGYQYQHQPFSRRQCYTCHDPHAADHNHLLKNADPGICFTCHQSNQALSKSHQGRDMSTISCLGCHQPHGSDNSNLLRQVRHRPFNDGHCNECHGRAVGVDRCLACHQKVLASFLHPHTHLRGDGTGNLCLNCHNPHAADHDHLLISDTGETCRKCHAVKFERRQQAIHKHPGKHVCSECHKEHGADRPAMLRAEPQEVCARCHQEHKQFTHPIGDQALDPRNGKPMDCLTCHDPCNGTMYTHNLRRDGKRSLCIQCHQKY